MAFEKPILIDSGTAAASLATKQNYFVKLGASGWNTVAAANDVGFIGVLTNKPAADANCDVVMAGLAKVVAGGTITLGAAITVNSSGAAIVADGAQEIFGYAREAAASGAKFTMFLNGKGLGVTDSDGTSGLYVAKYAIAVYDFDNDGGGDPGAITLTDAVTIPDNAICELVSYDVLTTCTTADDSGTMKLNLVTDGDLSTAIAISDASNPFDAGAHLGAVLTPLAAKTTAARLVQVTTATQAFTAGKVAFCIRYWVSA